MVTMVETRIDDIPKEFRINLEESAEKIRRLSRHTVEDVVEIGRELKWVKAHLEHGLWEKWVREELGWHPATAWRFIDAARRFENLALTQELDEQALIEELWGNTQRDSKPKSKVPLVRWSDESREPSLLEIKAWASKPGLNWGVRCGENLAVIDCDSEDSYLSFIATHELPLDCPVVKTRRGYHIWMKPINQVAREHEAEGWRILWKSEVEALAIKDDDALCRDMDIVEVMEALGIRLKKVGNEYIGLCPFHDDHDTSLSVNRGKNVWYCFGCGKGGDIHRFIQEWQSRDTGQGYE